MESLPNPEYLFSDKQATEIFCAFKKSGFSEKPDFSENFIPENLCRLAYVCGYINDKHNEVKSEPEMFRSLMQCH